MDTAKLLIYCIVYVLFEIKQINNRYLLINNKLCRSIVNSFSTTMSSLLKITPRLLLIVGLMLQGIADASPSKTPEWDPRRGKLIFEDNFDTLNTSTWLHLITSWRGGENVTYIDLHQVYL